MSWDVIALDDWEKAEHHGYVAPAGRTKEGQEAANMAIGEMPEFAIDGPFSDVERAPLWSFFKKIGIDNPPYNWQVTGSCVGAGGDNALKTLMAVEVVVEKVEEFHVTWWLYTYGKSRELAGMNRPGDGSYGSTWAKAIKDYGSFRADEEGLPEFRSVSGWLQTSSSVEYKWSDGDEIPQKWIDKGREHLVKRTAPVRDSDQAAAALMNGYPLTIASMFGTRSIRSTGSPKVNIAKWDASWAHQMFVDEVWKHPTEGLIFRVGNNWGPSAHPRPVAGAPAGGFYITAKTFDKIASSRNSEIFALSGYDGFPVQKLDWDIISW